MGLHGNTFCRRSLTRRQASGSITRGHRVPRVRARCSTWALQRPPGAALAGPPALCPCRPHRADFTASRSVSVPAITARCTLPRVPLLLCWRPPHSRRVVARSFTRVGCMILLLHDACDILMELAKMCKYLNQVPPPPSPLGPGGNCACTAGGAQSGHTCNWTRWSPQRLCRGSGRAQDARQLCTCFMQTAAVRMRSLQASAQVRQQQREGSRLRPLQQQPRRRCGAVPGPATSADIAVVRRARPFPACRTSWARRCSACSCWPGSCCVWCTFPCGFCGPPGGSPPPPQRPPLGPISPVRSPVRERSKRQSIRKQSHRGRGTMAEVLMECSALELGCRPLQTN